MDLVIYRENTEGFYSDRNMCQGIGEMMPDPDMALSMRKISRRCCMRICRQAFDAASGDEKNCRNPQSQYFFNDRWPAP